MDPIVLRDADEARQYLLQGLWFQRVVHPNSATVASALNWSLAIANAGHPLPPTGFVADVGHAALGKDRDGRAVKDTFAVPGWSAGRARTYEDHVLGKFYGDWTFERASDALKRLEPEKQGLGLAYLVDQLRERAGFGGVELSPGIIRGLLANGKPDEHLKVGLESLRQDGPSKHIVEIYDQIIRSVRVMAEVLELADVTALELKTALLSKGEDVARRQIEKYAKQLDAALPMRRIKPLSGRREVPTRVLDEDAYPVGGFASIATRGSIESLLHSQLAYMEPDRRERPDLFDVKFLRDELYYYSRDENQFLRRRRGFLFVLYPDLMQARFKDADLPCQRLVLVLALLLAAVRKLSDWLSTDALRFEFLLVQEGDGQVLQEEAKLLNLLFRQEIENETVSVESASPHDVAGCLKQLARRSACQCLVVGVDPPNIESKEAIITTMTIDSARPRIRFDDDDSEELPGDEPFDSWVETLIRLLQMWV